MKTLAITAALLLAACGGETGGGGKVPAQFAGTWSSDCATPFVTFADSGVTIHPVETPYALRDAKIDGDNFLVSYVNPDVPGTVTETYAIAGDTLRLTTSAVDGKMVGTFTKNPMRKCG